MGLPARTRHSVLVRFVEAVLAGWRTAGPEFPATDATNEVARYAALLATGTYAAAYLGVALSR